LRVAAFLALFAALTAGAASGAARSHDPGVRRAYFRAATPEARQRLAPFIARELPDGIVCAAIPPAMMSTLSAAHGLSFLGYEAVYSPVPIEGGDLPAGATRPGTTADGYRDCFPTYTPRVGWGIKAMYDDTSLVQTSGGAGVKVGVIDTGVWPHLDIVRRLVKCTDMTDTGAAPQCADSMGHGTMVASIIAADGGADGLGMWGMAPEASLYSYRVCDENKECWGATVAAAIHAAIDDGVNIINISMAGAGNDEVVRTAIVDAYAHNILVIVAAGNSPPYSHVAYPAVYPQVVSVGAIARNMTPSQYTAPGANDGDYNREAGEVEVAAPGEEVLVATKGGCWALPAGTSLAAPMVSGLAAKLWNGDMRSTRARLDRSARFHDLQPAGDDTLTGFGLPTPTDFSGSFVIGASAGVGGTVSPVGSVRLSPGATQTFTIAPALACHPIEDVKVDGVSRGPITSYTFTDVQADHALNATFKTLGPYTITSSAGSGGAINPRGTSAVACGGRQVYTITPGCGSIKDVKVDGVSVGPVARYTFTDVTAAHSISATFNNPFPGPEFTIVATGDPSGSLSPSGTTTVMCGDDLSYAIEAVPGCSEILDVKVDGVSQGPITGYTFVNVQANHTINAKFSAGISYIKTTAGPGGRISPGGTVSMPCGFDTTFTIAAAQGCGSIADVKVDGLSQGPITSYRFVRVSGNHTISATFNTSNIVPVITTSAGPGGVITPSGPTSLPCGGSLSYSITPNSCHRIVDVKVDGVSQGPVSVFTFANVGANHTIEATFVPDPSPLTITASAGPGGSISPSGANSVPCGTDQTYSIAVTDGCLIENVVVDGASLGPVARYTFTNVGVNHAISATFISGPFTIAASAGPGGTIEPSGTTSVACRNSQTYTLGVTDACVLDDVKVDGVSQGRIASYTFNHVEANHTISASFLSGPFTINARASAGGLISPSGVQSVPCRGSQAYAISLGGACGVDVKVDGVSQGPITSYTFTDVTRNHDIFADFSGPGPFTITASATAGGTISPAGATIVPCTGSKTYTIALTTGCTLVDVKVDGVSQGPITSYTFSNVVANHTISASFSGGQFTITAGPPGVIAPSGTLTMACAASQTYTITPGSCGTFNVVVDGVSLGPITTYTFSNPTQSHTISVSLSSGPFTINATTGFGGSITPAGVATVACGTNRTYQITPSECYRSKDVVVDGNHLGAMTSYTFSDVKTNHTILAMFSPASPTIVAEAGPGGSISPAGSSSLSCRANLSCTITPADNCHAIRDVKVDGVSRGAISFYQFSSVTSDHTIQATFVEIGPYTIDARSGSGGIITPGGPTTVACGASPTFTFAVSDECHRIADVKVDGSSRGPLTSYTFPFVRGNESIELVVSELGPYTIAASAGPGGTITPQGESSAACGASASYAVAPSDACHAIQDVKVDGVSQGPIKAFTFSGVAAPHAIEATFAALGPYTVTASPGSGATIQPAGASSVACGGSVSYTIAPELCQAIRDVHVDGASVGTAGSYTFTDVRGDHIIAATAGPSITLSESHFGASWMTDGAIDLSVAGGTPPYSFLWSNGSSSEDLGGLAGGPYSVRVMDSQGCTSDLEVTIVGDAPTSLALGKPTPNPSAGPVRLRYALPAQGTVRVSVLDLQGREVAVLAEGSRAAGWGWATWDGATRGGRAPGGIYFIRLQAGGRQIVQRFALVR
jgi:hypothetical protein